MMRSTWNRLIRPFDNARHPVRGCNVVSTQSEDAREDRLATAALLPKSFDKKIWNVLSLSVDGRWLRYQATSSKKVTRSRQIDH